MSYDKVRGWVTNSQRDMENRKAYKEVKRYRCIGGRKMTTKDKAENGEPTPISGEGQVDAEGQFVCPKCGVLDTIQEVYLGPIVETRRWDGEDYELIYTNFDETTYRVVCPKCGAVLDEAEQG